MALTRAAPSVHCDTHHPLFFARGVYGGGESKTKAKGLAGSGTIPFLLNHSHGQAVQAYKLFSFLRHHRCNPALTGPREWPARAATAPWTGRVVLLGRWGDSSGCLIAGWFAPVGTRDVVCRSGSGFSVHGGTLAFAVQQTIVNTVSPELQNPPCPEVVHGNHGQSIAFPRQASGLFDRLGY